MKTVPKPWGEEWWLAHTDRYAGKILWVKKGQRLSMQYHERKHETQFVDDGVVRMEICRPGETEFKELILKKGDIVELPPFTKHRITAIEDAKIFEISTPELDDVVRITDDYGREGTSTS
jgi:mannose-6-phosphate isomerase